MPATPPWTPSDSNPPASCISVARAYAGKEVRSRGRRPPAPPAAGRRDALNAESMRQAVLPRRSRNRTRSTALPAGGSAPWSIELELGLSGFLDEAPLREALARALRLEEHVGLGGRERRSSPGATSQWLRCEVGSGPLLADPRHRMGDHHTCGGGRPRARRSPCPGFGLVDEVVQLLDGEAAGTRRPASGGSTSGVAVWTQPVAGASSPPSVATTSRSPSGRRTRKARNTVLVPANLRPPDGSDDVVSNCSPPARITTSGPGLRDTPPDPLAAVTAQTRREKQAGMGTRWSSSCATRPSSRLWAREEMVRLMPVVGNRLVDTATVSDLGAPYLPSFGERVADHGGLVLPTGSDAARADRRRGDRRRSPALSIRYRRRPSTPRPLTASRGTTSRRWAGWRDPRRRGAEDRRPGLAPDRPAPDRGGRPAGAVAPAAAERPCGRRARTRGALRPGDGSWPEPDDPAAARVDVERSQPVPDVRVTLQARPRPGRRHPRAWPQPA